MKLFFLILVVCLSNTIIGMENPYSKKLIGTLIQINKHRSPFEIQFLTLDTNMGKKMLLDAFNYLDQYKLHNKAVKEPDKAFETIHYITGKQLTDTTFILKFYETNAPLNNVILEELKGSKFSTFLSQEDRALKIPPVCIKDVVAKIIYQGNSTFEKESKCEQDDKTGPQKNIYLEYIKFNLLHTKTGQQAQRTFRNKPMTMVETSL